MYYHNSKNPQNRHEKKLEGLWKKNRLKQFMKKRNMNANIVIKNLQLDVPAKRVLSSDYNP